MNVTLVLYTRAWLPNKRLHPGGGGFAIEPSRISSVRPPRVSRIALTGSGTRRDVVRTLWRALFLAAGAVSLVICAVVLRKQGPVDSGAWATVAAALAVLAAMISAWTSQRQLELQEDAAQPAVLPAIDLRSRTNLAQFTMTNHGGSHAYSVAVKWDRPLLGRDGKPIALGAEPIPMIPKGESASVLVTSHQHE
jgi:hypothetical protein